MKRRIETEKAEKLAADLEAGKPGSAKKAAAALRDIARERDVLRRMDREAATHVESVICMRTYFDGDPPYVGWKGLGLALTEALDERDRLRAELADALREGIPLPRDTARFAKLSPDPRPAIREDATRGFEFLSTAELVSKP